MRRAFFLAFIIVVSDCALANGQGFRGGDPSRGSTISGQAPASGARFVQGRSLPQRSLPAATRGDMQSAFTSGSSLPVTTVQPPSSHQRRAVIVPPKRVITTPGLRVAPVAPRRHFHPPFVHPSFPKRRGILIIGVPHFVGTSVIITHGPWPVVRSWPRFAETPPTVHPGRSPGQLAPFDPTPQEVVERMLALAGVKQGDVVYDLGSGDGRVVIAAAKQYGVKAVGFEIDSGLVKLARENVRKEGVESLVEIREQDFTTADLSSATVVTLYLSQDGNLSVRPALMNQLQPGARVVSYTFDMGDWQPKIMETYRDAAGDTHLLYLWQIGEPMAFSDNSTENVQPQPTGNGLPIVEVR